MSEFVSEKSLSVMESESACELHVSESDGKRESEV